MGPRSTFPSGSKDVKGGAETALVVLTIVAVALAGCVAGPTSGGADDGSADGSEDTGPGVDPGWTSTPGGTAFAPNGSNVTHADVRERAEEIGAFLSTPSGWANHTGFQQFEPTIGVTSDGGLYMSTLTGTTGVGYVSTIGSSDGGRTWTRVNPQIGPVSSPPQSNDPYVHVDQDTDRIYNLDMQGLSCNYIQWSDDGGDSWMQNPIGCGQPPVLDHPTLFTGPPRTTQTVGYDNVVYLCVNQLLVSGCTTSLDGGLTFGPWRNVYTDPDGGPAAAPCGGLHAHGVTGPEGRAYLGTGSCGQYPVLAVSEDDGLTWSSHQVTDEVPVSQHDLELATDAAGNVYALWLDDDMDPYLAYSTDHGRSWSDPVNVAPPGVGTVQFPAIAAGDEGRTALVFYGTERDVNGTLSALDGNDTWSAYITTVVDATGDDPIYASTPANDPADPLGRGNCNDENRCVGEGGTGVGDFIDIVIDDDGRPWAALVDSCMEACATGENRTMIGGEGAVGTLASGPALRGSLGPLPPLHGNVSADAAPAG